MRGGGGQRGEGAQYATKKNPRRGGKGYAAGEEGEGGRTARDRDKDRGAGKKVTYCMSTPVFQLEQPHLLVFLLDRSSFLQTSLPLVLLATA